MQILSQDMVVPFVKIKDKFQVTIPSKIRERISLHIGDFLEANIDKNNVITLKPKVVVDREEESINEGMRDYLSGRTYGPFASIKEFEGGVEQFNKNKK